MCKLLVGYEGVHSVTVRQVRYARFGCRMPPYPPPFVKIHHQKSQDWAAMNFRDVFSTYSENRSSRMSASASSGQQTNLSEANRARMPFATLQISPALQELQGPTVRSMHPGQMLRLHAYRPDVNRPQTTALTFKSKTTLRQAKSRREPTSDNSINVQNEPRNIQTAPASGTASLNDILKRQSLLCAESSKAIPTMKWDRTFFDKLACLHFAP